ncbi:MAG: CDP-alcohol phosphatidyltransferase family protein [Anaerolineae bacterium]|nr:CDP-alcohol phosphatidyltransferase family protein [Anaerolineae bacterium]
MLNSRVTFTDRVRKLTGGFVGRMGMAFYRAGIHPDYITVAGLGIVVFASILIGMGEIQWGGLVLIFGLPLDALDGAVARAMQRRDQFGGLLDSTLDRYADGLIFASLGYYFASQNQLNYLVLALAALMGSYTVSYVRARAGEAGISVKVGLFTRLERVAVLLPALLIPPLLIPGMWILAIGTNVTGLQRVWFVYRNTEFTEM